MMLEVPYSTPSAGHTQEEEERADPMLTLTLPQGLSIFVELAVHHWGICPDISRVNLSLSDGKSSLVQRTQ